jgi:hydroxymethylpyrimidine pyrophosphatase-like HAD family hydrolase
MSLELPTYPNYPSIRAKIERCRTIGLVRILFVDIDATLILGAGHSAEEIEQSHRNCRELISRLYLDDVIIIPVTGGHYDDDTPTTHSIATRIRRGFLPMIGHRAHGEPFLVDAYVSDGGAHARFSDAGGTIVYDNFYYQHTHRINIDYEKVLLITDKLSRSLNDSLPLSQTHLKTIKQYDIDAREVRVFRQAGTDNGTSKGSNKISYHFYARDIAERDRIYDSFCNEMNRYDLKVICCEEKDANTYARRMFPAETADHDFPLKYCIDIGTFNKGSAVEYFSGYISSLIAGNNSECCPEIQIWGCGDSGNDLPLMTSPCVTHAIIVGGASTELKRMESQLIAEGKSVYRESDPLCLGPASILKAFYGLI